MTARPPRGEDPGAEPPEYAKGTWNFLKEFLGHAVVEISTVIVGFVVFTAAVYVLLPDWPVILYLGAGAFYTAAAWYCYEAVDMWRDASVPGTPDAGSGLSEDSSAESDIGRGACLEALLVFLLLNAAFLWFVDSKLWVASLAVSLLCAVLWVTMVLLHWPRLLMPAIHRKAQRP